MTRDRADVTPFTDEGIVGSLCVPFIDLVAYRVIPRKDTNVMFQMIPVIRSALCVHIHAIDPKVAYNMRTELVDHSPHAEEMTKTEKDAPTHGVHVHHVQLKTSMTLTRNFRIQETRRARIDVLSPRILRGTYVSIEIDAAMHVRAGVSPIAKLFTASFAPTRRAHVDMQYPNVTHSTHAHVRPNITTHVVLLRSTTFCATVKGDKSCHAVPRTLCITPPQAERKTSCDP